MSAIIPFDAQLPALPTSKRLSGINRDILGSGAPQFPVLSIKGKVFTLVKGSEKKILTRDVDGEEMAVQSLTVSVARANTKYRVFYASAFTEGEENKKPTCYSTDGVAPAHNAAEPQSKKCMGCAQNVWGVRDGKGTACSQRTRLAVVDPNNMSEEPILLNVPPASRKAWMQAVEAADMRGQDYNRMVLRMSFDKEAATPKLVFKPTGWLSDEGHDAITKLYDSDLVKDMIGIAHSETSAAPAVDADDVAAAIEAPKPAPKVAAQVAKAPEIDADDIEDVVAKPVAKPKAAAKPKAEPKPAPADDDNDDLLASIEGMLSSSDD